MPRHSSTTRRPQHLLTCLLTAGLAGCFSYKPAAFFAVRPGNEVRVTFAAGAGSELEQLLGPRVRAASGQVQEVLGDTALVVLLDDITTSDGDQLPWRRGRMTLPSRLLASVQQRTLDRRRTRSFIAAAVVTFTATVVTAIRRAGYSGSAPPTQGGAPPE